MDKLQLVIDKDFDKKSLRFFFEYFHIAKKKIYLLETSQNVLLNSQTHPFSSMVHTGDVIDIDLSSFEQLDFEPDFGPLKVLFEDEWVLVIDKSPGIIIYPEFKHEHNTLVNLVAAYYKNQGLNRQIRYLHRLDKDTSGVMIFAKNFLSHSYLSNLWDHEMISREYTLLVEGHLPKPKGTIDAPIGKDRHKNNHYLVLPTGKKAVTHYEVLKEFSNYSLIKCRLETGRTHQIRVHLSYLGNPLLGDTLYQAKTKEVKRVMLHSSKIEFFHPILKKMIEVSSPLDVDFKGFL
ncbi:MAG: RluA family pseudouridine synthase [Firmicutes bacterium]|nr:RluA family pseudouridine synthase [Bacillota bacterium]